MTEMDSELRFLAAVSHEIRNPMTSILGFTEVLLRDYLEPPENSETLESCRETLAYCKETIEAVHNNAEFLLSILNDILDYSKWEAGQLHVEKRNVPLRPFLDELTAIFTIQMKVKKIAFSVEILPNVPEIINTDPIRLRQILVNLIGNAIKFTAEGEVRILVSWNSNDGNLVFAVKDTGIGIASVKIPEVFLPFHQVYSANRHFSGSGLGLTISKTLIQLLGGDIMVESQQGQGSTFTVILPQQVDDKNQSIPSNSPQKHYDEAALSGRKILLVEDSLDIQRLFSFILKKAGAEIITAEDGQTAFDIASSTSFDMILMDADLPIMDGYTATRRLRELGYKNPIVALTACVLEESQQKFLDAGCNGYIIKPILRDAFIAAVVKNLR